MSRKHCRRRHIDPQPPRCFRPKLAPDQLLDLGLVHMSNLDLIAKGEGTERVLWDAVAGVLTWSRVADKLRIGVEEMVEQLAVVTQVIDRYARTGRIGFSGPEYQQAKLGVQIMDQLAELVDLPTAKEAADWSELRVNAMCAEVEQRMGVAA